MTNRELEAKAQEDFAAHVGKILLVGLVTGYNDGDDSLDVDCDPPARVRVRQTIPDDLRHWVDDWLDPYWDVELVEPHPALDGIRSMWVFGPSYRLDGSREPTSTWTVESTTTFQRIKDSIRQWRQKP